MEHNAKMLVAGLAVMLFAAAMPAAGQPAFKVPFPFQAGGKKLPAGEYFMLAPASGNTLTLRQGATGKEFQVPFTGRLPQPKPPASEPKLVFDEVGDFAPSYTEYVTVYILSEVWFPGQEGFRTHTTKGAHNKKTLTAIKH